MKLKLIKFPISVQWRNGFVCPECIYTHLQWIFSIYYVKQCRRKILVICTHITPCLSPARHPNIKVRINATGDTIVLKFLLPNAHTKLEGYILGYGSRFFSKQFIQLPENGLPFVKEFGKNVCLYPSAKMRNKRYRRKMMSFSTEERWQFVLFLYLDAEPKYLIAVKPIQINEVKKYCKGNTSINKAYLWCLPYISFGFWE